PVVVALTWAGGRAPTRLTNDKSLGCVPITRYTAAPFEQCSTIGESFQMPHPSTVIIGAGPAGLTAAYLLSKQGAPVTVLEADPTYVGGISRTEQYKGFYF